MSLKNRITRGWNVMRVFFIGMGLLAIFQAFSQHQWIGLVLGVYFVSMGLFGFGCASGQCYIPTRNYKMKSAVESGLAEKESIKNKNNDV